jgi:hypothetical protein
MYYYTLKAIFEVKKIFINYNEKKLIHPAYKEK